MQDNQPKLERDPSRTTSLGKYQSQPIVAVVIPAYRAEHHLAKVLESVPELVSQIIVVDDCSPDQTAVIATQFQEKGRRVHLIQHAVNQGVGGAVLSGYRLAYQLGAQVVVKMDSDGQMDPAYLPALIAPILAGEADYTKGNRFLQARALHSMPLLRRIGNIGLSFLIKLASGYWRVFDPTNGYTAIHASLIPLLNETAVDRRYFFESSMFLELGLLGAVVKDVYIPARYTDETSQLSELQALFEFPPRLLQGFMRRLWIQYFLRDFGLFTIFLVSGLILFIFGAVFGVYHWWVSLRLNTAATTGTVMLAVLPIILGVQFLLQAIVLDVQNMPARPLHHERDISLLYQNK